MPPSVICGRTRSTRPTSRRSTVVNGATVCVPPVVAYEPVTIGMFWPTMIRASSLSSVISDGVDRMLALTCCSSARARKPRLAIVPSPGMLTVPRITPMLRPCPARPGLTATSMMFVPVPRAPKLVPPTTRVCVEL